MASWSCADAQPTLQTLHRHLPSEVAAGRATAVGTLPPGQQLNLSIVLPLRNQQQLDSLLGRLYDPSSPDYRRFLSVAEFTEQFGPTAEDYQAVVAFAKAQGFAVTGAPANRLVVPLSGSVDQVSKAFHVTMNVYRHPTEDRTYFSPDREPSLDLAVPVAHIAGLNNFSLPHPMLKRSQQGSQAANVTGTGPNGSYLGSDMRAAYYGGSTLDGNGQSVGILEFGGYDPNDVNQTFANAGQAFTVPINNVLLDGASAGPDEDDSEQVLDIVQAIGMAPGMSQVRVYIGLGQDDPNILAAMASENLAKQLSCSWSWIPDDPTTDDVFFKEFAAQGQSFFAASGDVGAYDAAISPYFYPAEDAYVVAVGGTHLTTNGAGGSWASEVAWNSYQDGSGGGISPDGIAIPSWQAGLATSSNGGSTTERNVPDVAMEGDLDNYNCDLGYCNSGWGGTSFATPRWAAFMALVNQQAVEAGNAPTGGLGFLDPPIYAIGQGTNYSNDFHDITSGNNDTENQPIWYSAVSGYDLVTGWGSASGQDLIDDLAGKQVPGFWIQASSPTVSLKQGGSATTTIAVTDAAGFSGSVTLAVTSALPSGVTASWGTNPTTGSSVLTLTASASAAASTTTLTINGTAGTLTATTNVTVAVHAPTFTLSSAPNYVQVNPGGSATSTITLTPEYGFTGSANLSISGLPSGVTATFSPATTAGTSTLTLKASASAAGSSSTPTITGTSGGLTVTTSLYLLVAAPTFALNVGSPVNMGVGSSAYAYVFVNPEYGFTGNVSLAVSGLPSGVTASFSLNPATEYSILSLTTSSTAALGTKTVTITGTSGDLTVSTTFTLNVLAPAFTIAGPAITNIGQGTVNTYNVLVNPLYGFTGSVSLAASGLPAGVTASFSPNPATGYATVTLTASGSAPLGSSTITITGTSGKLTASTTFTLAVYAPTFTLSGLSTVAIGQGTQTNSTFYVNAEYGFTGNVALAISGLPAGVTASFSPNPSSGYPTGYTTLTLTASSTASLGTSNVTITGTSGKLTVTTDFTLGVYAQNFTVQGPGSMSIGQGTTSTTNQVNVSPEYGFTGSVNLVASGLPSGVTASFSPNPTTGSAMMTLTASSAASLGTSTVTITGTSGKLTASTTFSLVVATPTFTVSGSDISVGQGSSATSYVSVNPEYGFNGSANLAVSGLPSGVTASFSPNPTNGNAVLTIAASSSATVGQQSLTITGTCGSQTASTTVTLTIYAPTFALSGPGAVTVGQGTSATSYVYVQPNYGFTGSVSFAVSGLPSGVTASILPNPSSVTGTLVFTASSSAAAGTTNVTVTGTYGTQKVTTAVALTVAAPSFTLYNYGNASLSQGSSTTAYVEVSPQNGFTGSVNLSVSGLPSGVTAAFSPNPTTGEAVLTLNASNTAAVGTSTVTITGTSGSLTATTTFSLTVGAPSFTISGPGTLNFAPGGSATSYVNIYSQNGFTGSVSLSLSGLPSGVTASISPNPTTGSATLALTASSSAAVGTSTVTITGTSGTLTASTMFSLTLSAPTFTLSDFGNVTLGQGTSGSAQVYVNALNGFAGSVRFTVSGLPAGVTASFSPNPSTAGSSTLTLTASSSAALGNATLTIDGTSGTQTATTTLALTVATPSFSIGAYGGLTLGTGTSITDSIYIESNSGTLPPNISLSISGLPSGVAGSFSPNPTANGSSTLTLTAAASASLGQYNVLITGTAGKVTASTFFTLTVSAPSFTLTSYENVNIGQGASGTSTVYVNPQYGFTGSVHLSVSGLPSGVTATVSPNPSTGYSTLSFTANSGAATGQYTVTVTGTSGSQTASTTLSLGVYAPAFTIGSSENVSLGQGSSGTGYLYIYPQYGFTGNVSFSVSGLPRGVTASFSPNPATGNSTLTLTAGATAALGEYTATVTGISGKTTASTPITVSVYPPSFSVSGPGSVNIGQGTSTPVSVAINPDYGFTGSVRLSVSGLPSGVSASFSPNPTTGNSTLTLTAASTASLGQYNVTLTGTSGSQSTSTTFALAVYVPTFTITSYTGVTLGQGGSGTSYIYINPNYGFTGAVSFAASGLPSGVTASFSPNPSSGDTATLTLTASSTASLGQYSVTVTGTSGTQSSSTSVPVAIYAPTFTLLSSGYVSIDQGSSGTSFVNIEPGYGFNSNVSLAISGLPSGVTASFSPNPTAASSTLRLSVASTVPAAQYGNILITGTSGALSSSSTLVLNVVQAQPAAEFYPTSLTFPKTIPGGSPAPISVTLTNPGSGPLSVKSFTFTGTNASEFEIYGKTCTTTLAAGASCTLAIAFKPTAAGTATASLIATDNAATSPQAVTLSGTVIDLTASFSPASLSFPATAIGATSAPQTVTFTNLGSSALQVTSFTFTGTNGSEFEIYSKTCTTSLAAGASCTLEIAYKPTLSGNATASLVATDDGTNSPQTVALSGTVAVANATLSPSALTFPATAMGITSAPLAVTFTNPGATALTVKSFTFSGTDAADFAISSKTCGTTLAAGASCTLEITFKPSAAGSASASLVATDAAANSPQTVALSGTTPMLANFYGSGIGFNFTDVGAVSSSGTVTFHNASATTLSIQSFNISGADASNFEIVGNSCPALLAAGAECTLQIVFKPTVIGSAEASLIATDSATNSPQVFTLTGITPNANATIAPSALTFASTAVGSTSASQTITLTNPSSTAISVFSFLCDNVNPDPNTLCKDFIISSKTCTTTLAAGASCTVQIAYKPTSIGPLSALFYATDAAGNSPQTVALSGTGH